MSAPTCEQLHAFAAGELPPEQADAFRHHLGSCEACAGELHALMMVEALEQTRRPASPSAPAGGGGEVRQVRAFPSRLARLAPAVIAPVLAAAAAWMLWGRARPTEEVAPTAVALATAPTRSLEVRLAYAGADTYRPYDVSRAAGAPRHEDVPLATLAGLEKRGDLHGVGVGLVLAGDDARAETYLAKAPPSPDVAADRAALLLEQDKPREALEVLDAVLATSPSHPQAMFNRALALRDLDVPLAAAEAFDRAAALDEKGWADEARSRGAALRVGFERRQAAWKAGDAAATAMGGGGPVVGDEVVAATPDLARGHLYQALRTAASRARVLELAPLARRLDERQGGHLLSDLVERVSKEDFARRAPLAATYASILAHAADAPHDAKAIAAYLAAVRAAHQDDLLLGAIQFTNRLDTDLDEYERLAAASHDPWFFTVAAGARAEAQSSRGDWPAAERTLRGALDACRPAHVDWKCATLERDLAWLLVTELRTTEARAVAESGLRRARELAPYLEPVFQYRLADIARYEGDAPRLAAHAREAELESPGDCELMRATSLDLAQARLVALDAAGAARELDRTPRCDQPITLLAADEVVDAVRLGGAPAAAATLHADLAAIRPRLPADEQPGADTILARLAAVTDLGAGERQARAALEEVLRLPAGDALERDGETYARRTLAMSLAAQGRAEEAMQQIAASVRARGATLAPPPCSLGVAVDGPSALAVTLGPGGDAVADLTRRSSQELSPATLMSAAVGARLASCPQVRVYAMPPLHGMPGLLPPSTAWAYVSSEPSPPAPAAPRRVVVTDAVPPGSLGLPRLGASAPPVDGVTWLHGPQATPEAVLAQLRDATEVEIDAHGIVDSAKSSASLLALSPDAEGRFTLSAGDLAPGWLRARPIVVLGACHAAKTAPYFHQPWSLPSAFVRAGARAVLASPDWVSDAEAHPFFDAVLTRIRAGAAPAVALRDERIAWLARDPGSWVASVMDFE